MLKLTLIILLSLAYCVDSSSRREKIKKKLLSSNRVSQNNEDGQERDTYDFTNLDEQRRANCHLNGLWYNQHGSELYINHTDEMHFCGEYRTAVEVDATSQSGELMGHVRGKVIGKLLSFNVFWKNGESVTTWTGQCHKPCDMGYFSSDHTTLHTNWLMTSTVESCDRHWMATRTGQDIFTRDATIKDGPRRSLSNRNGDQM